MTTQAGRIQQRNLGIHLCQLSLIRQRRYAEICSRGSDNPNHTSTLAFYRGCLRARNHKHLPSRTLHESNTYKLDPSFSSYHRVYHQRNLPLQMMEYRCHYD